MDVSLVLLLNGGVCEETEACKLEGKEENRLSLPPTILPGHTSVLRLLMTAGLGG